MKTFGENLKKIIDKNNWTYQECADIIGTSKQTISNYINEVSTPKYSDVIEFCIKLGVTPNDLMWDSDALVDLIDNNASTEKVRIEYARCQLDLKNLKDKMDKIKSALG